MSKLCCISVDLDEICHYRQIHGLSPAAVTGPAVTGPGLVYETALQRLSAWSKAQSIPLTWFVVGSMLGDAAVHDRLRKLAELGDELGNHSEHHYYDLVRRDPGEMHREVEASAERLRAITGETRIGFRAPGYLMSDELARVLRSTGVLYDSSVFPCPLYYAAKSLVLLGQRALGRHSRSLMDHPRALIAPTAPYRQGAHYWQRERDGARNGLLELPITVSPGARLPFIGTQLAVLGPRIAGQLAQQVSRLEFVNLELHGMDALDVSDGLSDLGRVQPDVRIRFERKLETFGEVVQVLRKSGFSFVTLGEAARARFT